MAARIGCRYHRDAANLLVPPSLYEVDSLGKSPVITDALRIIAELIGLIWLVVFNRHLPEKIYIV
jgi:hypothetical protein